MSYSMSIQDKVIQQRFRFSGRNRNLPWYPLRGRREDVVELFSKLGYKVGVEVGTRFGTFAKIICDTNPGINLSCVDPFAEYDTVKTIKQAEQDKRFADTSELLKQYNVKMIRKMSIDALDDFENESLDFVYIDGNHRFDYAMMDIILWSCKVKTGGMVLIHDYHPWVGCDVVAAVDAYTRAKGVNPWYVTREFEPTAYWIKK